MLWNDAIVTPNVAFLFHYHRKMMFDRVGLKIVEEKNILV